MVLVPVQPQATEDIKSNLYLRVIFVLSAVCRGFKLKTSCVFIFQNFSVDMTIFVTSWHQSFPSPSFRVPISSLRPKRYDSRGRGRDRSSDKYKIRFRFRDRDEFQTERLGVSSPNPPFTLQKAEFNGLIPRLLSYPSNIRFRFRDRV